jgi:hypothetical protein
MSPDEWRRERHARRLLHCYPRAWRERFGEEFLALLESDITERPHSLSRFADVVRCGLTERLVTAGLSGERISAERRLRVSVGVVGLALAAFLTAGVAIWSQVTIGWQWAQPRGSATIAAMWMMSAALLALVPLAVLAAAPVLRALARALAGGRARELVLPLTVALWGGVVLLLGSRHFGMQWPGTGGHFWSARGLVPAAVAKLLWAGTSWVSTYWLHPSSLVDFPTIQIAWMALSPMALAALLGGSAIVIPRLELSVRALRFEAVLALLATAVTIVFLAGAACWVLAGGDAPFDLFGVGVIDYLGLAVMGLALVVAARASRRALVAGLQT